MRVIYLRDTDRSILRLITRLENVLPLAKRVGTILMSASMRSFTDQRMGTIAWPKRYPNQGSHLFVNIAGLLSDLNRGASIKARRFQERPALIDTRLLARSVAAAAYPTRVVVGSSLPYASVHNFGGESKQPVTMAAKLALAKFLRSKRGRPYRPKLGFLFSRSELTTRHPRRPFVGIPQETEDDIVAMTEDYCAGTN